MLELHSSNWKIILKLLGLFLFVAVGYWLTTNPNPARRPDAPLWGWVSIAAASVALAAWIPELLRRGPQVIISEAGIEDRRTRLGLIPWPEVAAARVSMYPGGSNLMLTARNPDVWRERLGWSGRASTGLRRALGLSEFAIPISGLDRNPSEVVAVVRQHIGPRLAG